MTMTAAPPVTRQPSAGEAIREGTIVLKLHLKGFFNSGKGDLSRVTTKANKGRLRLGKRLLECKALDELNTVDREIRAYVRLRAIQSNLSPGHYLLPLSLYEAVEGRLREFQALRLEKIEAFLVAYPAAIEAARADLDDQFNEANYPTEKRVRRRFVMDWEYKTEDAPATLRRISERAFEEARQRMSARFEDAANDYSAMVREMAAEVVTQLSERLHEGKVFRKDSTNRLQAFMDVFGHHQAVTNDGELGTLMGQLQRLMDGVTPDAVKPGTELRDNLRGALDLMREQIGNLVQDRPRRALQLED